jgi:hypothetical protein
MVDVEPWWVTLLRELQRDRFSELSGSRASIALRVSDRLVSREVARHVPPHVPVRELDIVAQPDDIIAVRLRLTKPAFLPPLQIRLAIERQPELPSSPQLVLALVSQGVAGFAAIALKFADVLPPGVRFVDGRFVVDFATILAQYDAAELLTYLKQLRITTVEGRFVIQAEFAVWSG